MRVFNHLRGDFDVFGKSVVACVYHNGSEPVLNSRNAEFVGVSVVEMQADGKSAVFHRGFNQFLEVAGICVFARAGANLKNEGGVFFFACLHDTLYHLHVVHVERAYGVTALIRFAEHFLSVY